MRLPWDKYELITYTDDEKIVGASGWPFEVGLPETLRKYIQKSDLKESYRSFIDNMPEDIHGHMIRKKRTIDFMDTDIGGPLGVISERFKNVLIETKVDPMEYNLVPMKIDSFNEIFYLLFAPYFPFNKINFKESIFTDDDLDEDIGIRYYKYDSYQSYLEAPEEQREAYELVLDKKYEKYDIIKFNYIGTYFSPRLQKAIEENGIVGVAYFGRRSDFYVKLSFK